jgi:hypothetical protein
MNLALPFHLPTVSEDLKARLAQFSHRWLGREGLEQQLSQMFLLELCEALGTAKPGDGTLPHEHYQFEKQVFVPSSTKRGRIDLYKRDHFVLEAKCGRASARESGKAPVRGTRAYWSYIEEAYNDQARVYASLLPEGRPPALIVVDIGWHFWIWLRQESGYAPFHSPKRIDIPLQQLADEESAALLRAAFEAPWQLDTSRFQARVTVEVASTLAPLAESLQKRNDPQRVARFLIRCLFCLFAEDVLLDDGRELLAGSVFTKLLEKAGSKPALFRPEVARLFAEMRDGGTYNFQEIRRFNGALFGDTESFDLTSAEIGLLSDAAKRNWSQVDPAIFGTLIERALDPNKRRTLGAHYTPRAFVERVVHPTILEPLRTTWDVAVRGEVERLLQEADVKTGAARADLERQATDRIDDFLHTLVRVEVLDPACGTGNFLYVAFEAVKDLEYEVRAFRRSLGGAVQGHLELATASVVPTQFHGIEKDPFAAEIAQVVLWIGELQWRMRHQEWQSIPDPVISTQRSIRQGDALITWTGTAPRVDEAGQPLTRWIWGSYVPSPTQPDVLVPDPAAREPLVDYLGVARTPWPEVDFIVGNPPFIGNKPMRERLGDGYVDAVRRCYAEVPETVDFVMYWWHRAAERLTAKGTRLRRFGLITTNSIKQAFNRQVLTQHSDAGVRLVLAVPDHPWDDDGAAVRISLTIAEAAPPDVLAAPARLLEVVNEDEGHLAVELRESKAPTIHPDLRIGADVSRAVPLQANAGVSFQGMNLVGDGFRLTPDEVRSLGFDPEALPPVIKPYLNAREMMRRREGRFVIDAFGLTADELKAQWPSCYQWLWDRVKPERDENRRTSRKKNWWLFGEPVGKLRAAWTGLARYLITPETSKHRAFTWVPAGVVPDHTLYAICLDQPEALGVLQSRIHTVWATTAGGTNGVGNDPRYNNTKCFAGFAFPIYEGEHRKNIARAADAVWSYRTAAHQRNPALTLTIIHNLLDLRRANAPIPKELAPLHAALATDVLLELHTALDHAVADAYGWPHDLSDDELLLRLVALNRERAAEEASGTIRWLRTPNTDANVELISPTPKVTTTEAEALPWPKDKGDQLLQVLAVVAAADRPLDVDTIARRFKHAPRKAIAERVQQLAAFRHVVVDEAGRAERA